VLSDYLSELRDFGQMHLNPTALPVSMPVVKIIRGDYFARQVV
jgi:hypothetical protein